MTESFSEFIFTYNPSIDNQDVVKTMQEEFHGVLVTLENRVCSVCLERYYFSTTNHGGICTRCHNDTLIPKLYSDANNMASST